LGLFGSEFGSPGDPYLDIDREFRRLDRQMRRLERNLLGDVVGGFGGGNFIQPFQPLSLGINPIATVGSLVNQALPILPNYIDQGDKKLVQFQVDTSGFSPEEICIKTDENRLEVCGKHEVKSGDFHRIREFRRSVNIPPGVKVEEMKSRLTPDGLLTLEAPVDIEAIQGGVGQKQAIELPIHRGDKQKSLEGIKGQKDKWSETTVRPEAGDVGKGKGDQDVSGARVTGQAA
jgi:HSP20 family molecular chaperone IbpA